MKRHGSAEWNGGLKDGRERYRQRVARSIIPNIHLKHGLKKGQGLTRKSLLQQRIQGVFQWCLLPLLERKGSGLTVLKLQRQCH